MLKLECPIVLIALLVRNVCYRRFYCAVGYNVIRVCVWQVEIGWQERAPRSLSKDYVEAVDATPKPPNTRPQDVFISVKTTGSYHRARLPVILRTWFQLAKHQVSPSIMRRVVSCHRRHS